MRNFSAIALLFLANTLSGIAQGISMIAIPWYFAQQAEMTRFGLAYALATIISFLWVPYSGTLIDKYNRKHIFLSITTISGIIVLAIAGFGLWQGGLPWWLVAAVFVLTFFNYNIHYPNLYAFAQEITEKRQYGRITSILEIVGQSTNMLAGAGAAILLEGTRNGYFNVFGLHLKTGWIIQPWPIEKIFLMDGLSYFLAFLIILGIRYQPLVRRQIEEGSMWKRLQTGASWLREHANIFWFGILSYAVFATVLLEVFYLGANYVKQHLRAPGDVFAASEMFFALGALFAGLAIRRIFYLTTAPVAVTIMTFITAGIFLALGFTQHIPVFYGAIFLLGINNAGIRIQRVTYLFNHIPNQVYGRASSIYFIFNAAMRLLLVGVFAFPLFQTGSGVALAFGLMGGLLVLAGLGLIRNIPDLPR